jgi:YHS domain-containing protein
VFWFIRLLILLLLIRLLIRVAVAAWTALGRPGARDAKALPLVRDPFCGTFVPPSSAVVATMGGEVRYFCSERCREAFARR